MTSAPMNNRYRITGRVAAVTGAAGGIGRAVTLGLARAGLDVAVIDVRRDVCDPVAAEASDLGGRAESFAADLSLDADVQRVLGEINEVLGHVDVLINCAGIYPRSSVLEMSVEEWDRVLAINLRSIVLLVKAVVPSMKERGYGRVLSFTSDLGTSGIPSGSHYAVSKAGLNVFTRSIGREIAATDVTINAIAPGATDTSMLRGSNSGEYIEAMARQSPIGRLGTPEDVLGMVLFLISDDAATINGQIIALRQ